MDNRFVVCGFPKAGTHALKKACELLGRPALSGHWRPSAFPRPDGDVLFIIRDPRDLPLSYLRFMRRTVSEGTYLSLLRHHEGVDEAMIPALRDFGGWMATVPTFRYEALIADDREMRRLADTIGEPYLDGAWELLPGLTATWNPVHSDHRTIWTPRIADVWDSLGGNALLEEWGYGTADPGR